MSTTQPPTYGHKHDALVQFQARLQALGSPGHWVIPRFYGISSERIQACFSAHISQLLRELKRDGARCSRQELESKLASLRKAIAKHSTALEDLLPLDWLNQAPGALYAVRSSALNEDGTSPLAGVYQSFTHVPPKKIARRVWQVVASYFSYRGWTATNPDTPFSCPVLIQQMAGEAELPSSPTPAVGCVLRTNVAEWTGDTGRHMTISANWGGIESVTQNLGMATDTFHLLPSSTTPGNARLIKQCRPKKERVEAGARVKNPLQLVNASTLDEETAHELYTLGLEAEANFGGPVEIEALIQNGKIHIVQVRSFQPPKSERPASYLDPTQFSSPPRSAKVLILGHPQTHIIDPRCIVHACTLDEALTRICKETALVVVETDEPENSHATFMMKGRGIPCFFCPHGIEQSSHNREALVVSPQQGILTYLSHPTIIPGYVRHPTFLQGITPIGKVPQEPTERLSVQLQTEETCAQALAEIQSDLELLKEKMKVAHGLKKEAEEIDAAITMALEELNAAPADRLHRLFYLKYLEVHLPAFYSLLHGLDRMIAFEEKGCRRLSPYILTPTLMQSTQEKWGTFLHHMETTGTEEQIVTLQQTLEALQQMRPLWLTVYFEPAFREHPLENLFSVLFGNMNAFSRDFIHAVPHMEVGDFTQEHFPETFEREELHPCGRLLALQRLLDVGEELDLSIKRLYCAKNLTLEEKNQLFAEKIEQFYYLFVFLVQKLGHDIRDREGRHHHLDELRGAKKKILASPPSEEMFSTSRGNFHRMQECIVNTGYYVKHGCGIKTRGELHSVIHGNFFMLMGFLIKKYTPPLSALLLPDSIHKCLRQLPLDLTVRLEQRDDTLIPYFVIVKDGNHSYANIQLHIREDHIHFAVQMLGSLEEPDVMKIFVKTLEHACILRCSQPPIERASSLEWTWIISSAQDMKRARKALSQLLEHEDGGDSDETFEGMFEIIQQWGRREDLEYALAELMTSNSVYKRIMKKLIKRVPTSVRPKLVQESDLG